MWKRKHYLRHENKVNENQICNYERKIQDVQKVDQHTRGKWLIHHTERRKDNQLQSLELPCRIS